MKFLQESQPEDGELRMTLPEQQFSLQVKRAIMSTASRLLLTADGLQDRRILKWK
jgi:hypothetical protein